MSKWSERYSAVVSGVRHGHLKRPRDAICQECGAKKAHKHHDDYSKPLDVMYLCPKCHIRRHREVLKWGGGRQPGKWKYNFSVLDVGSFVFIKAPQQRLSAYLNQFKTAMMPDANFKSFSFNGGTIVFRTK